jgi:hypothetical protein
VVTLSQGALQNPPQSLCYVTHLIFLLALLCGFISFLPWLLSVSSISKWALPQGPLFPIHSLLRAPMRTCHMKESQRQGSQPSSFFPASDTWFPHLQHGAAMALLLVHTFDCQSQRTQLCQAAHKVPSGKTIYAVNT